MNRLARVPLTQILSETCTAKNMMVAGYPTSHFDAIDGPTEEFERMLEDETIDQAKVRLAAQELDRCLAIYKIAIATKKIDSEHFIAFEDHLSVLEDFLDEIDDLQRHTYLHGYLEPIVTDLLDTDDLLSDAELEDYEGADDDLDFDDEALLGDLDAIIGSDYDEDSEAEESYETDYIKR